MTLLLGLLKRFWPQVLGAVVLGAAVWWAWHSILAYGDARYEAGRQEVVLADAKATEALRKKVAALTAQNLAIAQKAKDTYDAEHDQILAAALAPVGTRQLCHAAPADHRDVRVPEAGGTHAGDAGAAHAARVVHEVPAPDHGLAGDRSRLLGALAGMADEQAAVIREFQARQGN